MSYYQLILCSIFIYFGASGWGLLWDSVMMLVMVSYVLCFCLLTGYY